MNLEIRPLTGAEIDAVLNTFATWYKERSMFERYLVEQQAGRRLVLVAWLGDHVAGYGTLELPSVWYEPWRSAGIAELCDLNVMTAYQKQGIGTTLVRELEARAVERGQSLLGISVEQTPEGGHAEHLYRGLGYSPDGRGITPADNELHLEKRLV